MTSRILCAIDLTHDDEARRIIAKAGRLAKFEDAHLSVMTVLPDYGSSWVGSFFQPGMLQQAADSASEQLHQMVREVLPDMAADVQHIVQLGSPYEMVLQEIADIDADLVVVGAHKPDFADRIIGPNASRIVRLSPVSTYVVRLSKTKEAQ